MYLVPHHKSGTAVSWELFSILCCKNAIGKQNVYMYISQCFEKCINNDNLHLLFNGFPNQIDKIHKNHTIIHFIRHPVDMILSGYNYHRKCREPSWTNVTKWSSIHIKNAKKLKNILNAQNTTFCNALNKNNLDVGIEAETIRTISADDGLTAMLRIHSKYYAKPNYYSLCMFDYINSPVSTWGNLSVRIQKNINIKDFGYLYDNHYTKKNKLQIPYAYRALSKFMNISDTKIYYESKIIPWNCKSELSLK